ncbi:MAG: MBL fold metallo-hydrolase [Candidatus Diapherotrites archaeon]|nr:MBL fold metallo-hydrolase [Candidatus Diapherotrites archaeon]
MANVTVLIEGYAKEVRNGWLASSTTILVKSDGKNIIVDPGCNREKLLNALKTENLEPSEIDFVFLSHGHIDHTLLAGIFENADIITFENLMYKKDMQLEFNEKILGSDTLVIETPGHTAEHCSLVVKTNAGVYVIAGDVFWWADGEEQKIDINKIDNSHPKELNMGKLMESRKRILEIADYVVPGHGKIFKAEKGAAKKL